MSAMSVFDEISRFLPFLGQVVGPEAEILLCDTEKILESVNPISDWGLPGKPLGDVERALLKEGAYRTTDYVSNYRALLPSCERLRSSTYFIKDADGELLGFLTVNIRVEALLHTRNLLDSLINGCKLSTDRQEAVPCQLREDNVQTQNLNRYEEVNIAVEDIIQSVTDEHLQAFGVPADRLTPVERQQIVRDLDAHGVFLVKGSIKSVAAKLACSEPTVYRYLQHLV